MSTTTVQLDTLQLSAINPRDALLARLKGQPAHIPDLKPIFADWRGISHRHISLWVDQLREKVKTRLQGFNFHQAKQERLEAADFGLFTALWWPDASLEKLQILAYLVIWLFTWDDEIDEPTGSYSEDFDGAQTYREHTLRFVGSSLGLRAVEADFHPLNPIVQSFDVIGSALRSAYDVDQRRRFYDEIARFMLASEEEQKGRLRGQIPTLEGYWQFRLGTSAVYIGTAAGEYSISSHLPAELMHSKPMQAIWDETNVIISITNDLLSLRKEMKLGCIDSIVPLIFATTSDVRRAMDEAVDALRRSKYRFDEAAKDLLDGISEDDLLQERVESFIEVQRSNCVGNLMWSLETQRYSMSKLISDDGSQQFIL
ncbi:isoprenoid synthase domain-containing protein [Xylariaceae sp. FL0016]|nr:isoprenoid synthase domain-containing protein [Xylariaceae sp. FL0016]